MLKHERKKTKFIDSQKSDQKEPLTISPPKSTDLGPRHHLKPPQHSQTHSTDSEAAKMSQTKSSRATIAKLENLQVLISSFLLVLIYLLSTFYDRRLVKFYTLQYSNLDYDGTNTYDVGTDDLYFIFYSIIFITFIRSFLLKFIFPPIAKLVNITKTKPLQRFKEQSWSLVYYLISFTFGFHMYYQSDYFLDCDKIYLNWPHDHLSYSLKLYYLIQTSNWFQQILALNLEAKRKDYYQMFSHHIITCCLCLGSYFYYFTHIGHVILLIMDIVDALFSLAKLLKYSGYNKLCDYMFGIFMMTWIALRHVVYNYIFYHALTKARSLMKMNCNDYPPNSLKICYTDTTIDLFLCLLGGLQVLTLIWMFLIAKVAATVIKGGSADDVRSDDDETDEEVDLIQEKKTN